MQLLLASIIIFSISGFLLYIVFRIYNDPKISKEEARIHNEAFRIWSVNYLKNKEKEYGNTKVNLLSEDAKLNWSLFYEKYKTSYDDIDVLVKNFNNTNNDIKLKSEEIEKGIKDMEDIKI